ncbi:MAG TPA: hypothetical protein VLT88_07125 [Desulfosarcina sp.]|nr:hypothetical protein [Desulfosarcina sp.]
MIPWQRIDSAGVPGSEQTLHLYRRGDEYSIRGDGFELMNSRLHGSEKALAQIALRVLGRCSGLHILIGGLGMGFTLAAALGELDADSRVTMVELVPEVVRWNRGPLADLAGRPLADRRVAVREADVVEILKTADAQYDAIILDVDNGPDGLTRGGNDRLYDRQGLRSALSALRCRGVLAVWSASPDAAFAERLRRAGFRVEQRIVAARGRRRGGRHAIWLAIRD